MVQPSYPKTIELPHSGPSKDGIPKDPGANPVTDRMAPSDRAPIDSHANEFKGEQAERRDTEAVNEGSVIRKEKDEGPGGPHHA
jgi:hypothetical protein